MKYKILLAGTKKTIIDDLFTKSSSLFEYQCTSTRFEDMVSHMIYFQPNAFLYCLNHDAPENFLRMAELKQHPAAAKTAFFTVGSRGECDTYTRTAPQVVDMVLESPINVSGMEDKMKAYFDSLAKPNMAAAPFSMNAAAPALNAAPAAPTVNTAAANSQPSAPAAAPQTNNTVPAGMQPQAGSAVQNTQQPQAGDTAQNITQTQAGFPAPAAPQAPAAASGAFDDDNDALLHALTEHVGEAAKVIEAVESLPLIDLEDEPEDDPQRRKHILVVDDDSRMLKIIKRHLAEKYDVATALNGRLALKFLETRKTDLILLDYEMPLESGPSILKKLRDNPFTRDIPVIFLTGISERDKIEKALVLKPQGYLLKPIDHIKLLSTISKLIG